MRKNFSQFIRYIYSTLLAVFFTAATAHAIPIAVGAAPDNNQAVLLKAISVASREIVMNVYELSNKVVADALVAKMKAGVRVVILVEGQPVGGFQKKAQAAQQYLVAHMKAIGGQSEFKIMTGVGGHKRRFRYNHAKYTIIDRTDVVVGSENYTDSGHPRMGGPGNRGWEVLMRSPDLAQALLKIFAYDIDMRFGDVIDARNLPSDVVLGQIFGGLQPFLDPDDVPEIDFINPNVDPWSMGGYHNTPIRTTDGQIVDLVRSPDNSLAGVIRVMRSAQRTLDVQLMSFNGIWGLGLAPFMTEILDAARRGVRVRVMLNDDSVFSRGEPRPNGNQRTLRQLRELGRELPLEAVVASNAKLRINYIHNKGIVVDGHTAFVSSINWTQNSVANNRELALVLRGGEVGPYYQSLFEKDWRAAHSQ
ncbi:MAG: hypothetical protein IT289_03740 [Oligoflexia bacterium]|nr:hypothetical protein [Oligoflexia bacterium]